MPKRKTVKYDLERQPSSRCETVYPAGRDWVAGAVCPLPGRRYSFVALDPTSRTAKWKRGTAATKKAAIARVLSNASRATRR